MTIKSAKITKVFKPQKQYLPHLTLVLASVAVFALSKLASNSLASSASGRLFVYFLLAVVAVVAAKIKTGDQPSVFRILSRSLLCLFIAYTIFAFPSVDIQALTSQQTIEFGLFRWIAVACGVAGLFRPAFGLVLLFYIELQKSQLASVLNLAITPSDYLSVLEFAIFVSIGRLLYAVFKANAFFKCEDAANTAKEIIHPLETLALSAIAVHFSSYFYSAVQKISIGDTPLQWVFENQTQYLMLAALDTGLLLLASSQSFTNSVYSTLTSSVVTINLATLAIQLFAIVAVVRIRWILIAAVLYDISHLAIFLVTGLLFYKWIFLNLFIVYALHKIRLKAIPVVFKAVFISIVLLAPAVFFVAKMGWFDTRSLNNEYFVAITQSGEEYKAPPNYFLSASSTFALQRIITPKTGHFATGALGAAFNSNTMRSANGCELATANNTAISQNLKSKNVETLIRRHHDFVLSKINADGRFNYNFYPHWTFSAPGKYAAFYRLDKSTIAAYRYVLESVCLTYRDKALRRDVKLRFQHDIKI